MVRQATWVLLAAGALVSIPSIHQDLTNNYDSNYLGFAQSIERSVQDRRSPRSPGRSSRSDSRDPSAN